MALARISKRVAGSPSASQASLLVGVVVGDFSGDVIRDDEVMGVAGNEVRFGERSQERTYPKR